MAGMSLGFPGPITHLTDYALTRTYRIQSSLRNAIRCFCKGCGIGLKRGYGLQVFISTAVGTPPQPYYFCKTCFRPVREAWGRWLALRETPEPGWWADLDKPIERTRTQREPLPAEELDRIIAERESRNS
jgi:hypothetical protein